MMARELVIREVDLADAPQLRQLLISAAEESQLTTLSVEEFSVDAERLYPFIMDAQMASNAICLLACLDDEVVGLINVKGDTQLALAHIGDVFLLVKEAYWGLGIGQLLLAAAVDWANESGCLARLELSVQVRNSVAIHIYEKFGFIIEGRKQRGIKTREGEYLDVYLMGKLIDQVNE